MRRARMRTLSLTAALTAVLTAVAGGAVAAPAAAHRGSPPDRDPVVVASGLVGPLSFDVTPRGELYVGEAFAGMLTHIDRSGERHHLVTGAPEVAAVSVEKVRRGHVLTWAESVHLEEDFSFVSAVVKRSWPSGRTTEADIGAYERATNPDAGSTYGFTDLDPACAATLPPFLAPAPGGVDSHPYGTVTVRGRTYVADAGANAVLTVGRDGTTVRTLAVLPPVPVEITADMAMGLGLDPCVAGHEVSLEPVPTDVELGRDGWLYVTTLPGGPEDGSLGANGGLWRVHPRTGAMHMVAGGFAGATGVAVMPDGTMYVAELFGNRLTAVDRRGRVLGSIELQQPAAVETVAGKLYVSVGVFGEGSVVRVHPFRAGPPSRS